jgi:hypothetical protein
LALLNSTASADSEERKLNRDRAIRRETIFYKFHITLYCQSICEGNRERLVDEIENVKKQSAEKHRTRHRSFA